MFRLVALLCCACLLRATTPKGTLVIVGGGGMPQEIMDAFLSASGGKGGAVGIIPTSTSDPDGALKEWKEDLEKVGLIMVPLDVRSREQASDPDLLARARTCTGFWFSGGDQGRVGDKIVGTPLQKVVLERYALEIGASGSYAAVRDFLQALEKANPYVCVTEVEILGRPENPAIHRIRIGTEWPVFGERKETPPGNKPAAPGGKRP